MNITRLKQLIAKHWGALLLGLFVSISIAAPQIHFRLAHESGGYEGIELLPDSPWSPRVREVMDGHPTLGSIYFKDGKSDPYLFQPLGSMTVAYMGKPFSLGINDTILFSRFVLPFITVLALYGFVYLVSRDKLAALASTAAVLLVDRITNLSGLLRLLHGLQPGSFLGLARPVNDAMIYIPFFGFLALFWLFYTRRHWLYGLLSAVLLAANFYNYFYSWTYLYAFGGILVLSLLVLRRWREALRVGGVFAGALFFVIPYGVNLFRAMQYPTYAEVGMRFGIVMSREPIFIGLVSLAALIAFVAWFPRQDRERYLFGLALLLAPILTLNQQLLTGKVMQAGHYHWYFHKPIALIFLLLTCVYLLNRWRAEIFKNALLGLILAAAVFVGAFTQVSSYLYDKDDGLAAALARQRYAPVMHWLNQNAAKEEVVLSNDPISYVVAIYTPLNLFYHRAGYASLSATRERLLDSLFTFYRLRGITKKEARDVFSAEREYISSNIYGIYYREFLGSYEAIPDETIEEILALYEKKLAMPTPKWLENMMTRYEVSYVVWDKKADPSWQLSKYPFLKESAVFGDLVIYRFTQ